MTDDPSTAKSDEISAYERRRLLDVEKLIKQRAVLPASFEDKESDNSYLYVPGEVLVAHRDEATATPILVQWGCKPDTKTNTRLAEKKLSVRRWLCPPEVSVPDLVNDLRSADKSRKLTAGPNHVFGSEPRWAWGGGGAPTPAAAYTPPTAKASRAAAHIGVLDTGVANDTQTLHPGLFKHLTDVTGDLDMLDDDNDGLLDSGAGHGTFVLGILNRIAPTMRLDMEPVLGAHGLGDELSIALGISEIQGAVINLSFGGYTHDNMEPTALRAALDLIGSDVVFVSAAGNHSTTEVPFWPAAFSDVVAVAAVDTRDMSAIAPAPFTNRGSWVDVCAPGVDIHSSYVNGKWEDTDGFAGYARWSGTSFAAPQVTAGIALWARDNHVTAATARDQLLASLSALPGNPDMGKLYLPPTDVVFRSAAS